VELCLFVRDEVKQAVEDWLEDSPVPGYVQVLSYKDLKSTYHDHHKRRELTQKYDAFVCDDSILPMLTRLLGETFRRAKMEAGAVVVDPAKPLALRRALEAARDSTYVRQLGAGSNTSVRVGTTAFNPDDLAENVMATILPTVARVPGGWRNVQQVTLKSETSVALPLYCAMPELEAVTGDAAEEVLGHKVAASGSVARQVLDKLAPSRSKIQTSIGAFDRFPELGAALGLALPSVSSLEEGSGKGTGKGKGTGNGKGKGKKRSRADAEAQEAGAAQLSMAGGEGGSGSGSGAAAGGGSKGKG